MNSEAAKNCLDTRAFEPDDLPCTVRRQSWANWFTTAVVFMLLGLIGTALFQCLISPNLADLDCIYDLFLASLLLVGCYVGIDSYGFLVSIDKDGVTTEGLLKRRKFVWNEIADFDTRRIGSRILSLHTFQAIIYVDGTNQPKRLLRNFFVAGHFIPTFMELNGEQVAKLLTNAKLQLERADPSASELTGADKAE